MNLPTMKPSTRALAALLVSLPPLGLEARTEWNVGRGAVTFDTTAGVTYDTNVEGNADGEDDVNLFLTPVARYRRIDSLFTSDADLSVTVNRYLDRSENDNEAIRANYSLNLPRDAGIRTYGASFSAGYNKSFEVNEDINQRSGQETYNFDLDGEVMLARRHLVRGNLGYRQNNRDSGSDKQTWTAGSSYSYTFNEGTTVGSSYRGTRTETTSDDPARPSLDQVSHSVDVNASRRLYADVNGRAAVGYRWLDRGQAENDSGLQDNNGYTLSLGLDGQFLPAQYFPKTTGRFSFGYEQSQAPGLNDDATSRVIGSIDIRWLARTTTTLNLNLSRAQELNTQDDTVVRNTASIGVDQTINAFLSANATVSYTLADYVGSDREDNRYGFRSTLNYQINRDWSAALAYTYTLSDSSRANADYDRHTLTLSANYAF
jgi:outer membrane protein assembly factor BamA